MAFRFLKKKRETDEGLPLLPPLGKFKSDIPIFPSLEEEGLPPLPKLSEFSEEHLPSFEEKTEAKSQYPNPEELLVKPEESVKRVVGTIGPKPMATVTLPSVARSVERVAPRRVVSFPKAIEKPVKIDKKTFIDVEHYKMIINSLGRVRSKIAEVGNSLTKIENISDNEQQKLEKWQQNLDIIQKKIIDVDKKIFK